MKSLKQPLLAEHPTFDPSKVWVLMWSQQQGMLHIETLAEMLSNHLGAFRMDLATEYVPLVIGDEFVVEQAAGAIRYTMAKRHDAKHKGEVGHLPYDQLP